MLNVALVDPPDAEQGLFKGLFVCDETGSTCSLASCTEDE